VKILGDEIMRLKMSQYLGFITIGLVSSIIGPMIATIKLDIPMSYSQVGFILSGQFAGMLPTVLIGGYLSDKYGKKPILIAGGGILSLGLLGSMLSRNYTSLLIWTLIIGIGFGIYEVGINALCSDSSDSNKGGAMNYLHFFFGIGAIVGPLIVTLSLKLFSSWHLVY
jgi:MFS family permease